MKKTREIWKHSAPTVMMAAVAIALLMVTTGLAAATSGFHYSWDHNSHSGTAPPAGGNSVSIPSTVKNENTGTYRTFVYDGSPADGVSNYVYLFDESTSTWTKLLTGKASGVNYPTPRGGECVAISGSGHDSGDGSYAHTQIIVYGGQPGAGKYTSEVDIYDVANNQWVYNQVNSKAPAYTSAECVRIDNFAGVGVAIFGGWNGAVNPTMYIFCNGHAFSLPNYPQVCQGIGWENSVADGDYYWANCNSNNPGIAIVCPFGNDPNAPHRYGGTAQMAYSPGYDAHTWEVSPVPGAQTGWPTDTDGLVMTLFGGWSAPAVGADLAACYIFLYWAWGSVWPNYVCSAVSGAPQYRAGAGSAWETFTGYQIGQDYGFMTFGGAYWTGSSYAWANDMWSFRVSGISDCDVDLVGYVLYCNTTSYDIHQVFQGSGSIGWPGARSGGVFACTDYGFVNNNPQLNGLENGYNRCDLLESNYVDPWGNPYHSATVGMLYGGVNGATKLSDSWNGGYGWAW